VLAPVEPDGAAILSERGGEGIGILLVPAIQHLSIKRTDLDLMRR
jgi:hypothetical protein